MLEVLAVEGYRSLRQLVVPLGEVTVITGPNGAGKSSLYRAPALVDALGAGPAGGTGVRSIRLAKEQGETRIEGLGFFDEPAWEWPKR